MGTWLREESLRHFRVVEVSHKFVYFARCCLRCATSNVGVSINVDGTRRRAMFPRVPARFRQACILAILVIAAWYLFLGRLRSTNIPIDQ